MKVVLTGIVRGAYSDNQELSEEFGVQPVMKLAGADLEDVVSGLVLPEWIFTLHVNGKRIADPVCYLKRKGVWKLCVRELTA